MHEYGRAEAASEHIKEYISDSFVCEIGCDNGYVLKEFSKRAKECLGIEINPPVEEAKQEHYHCDTTIIEGDAVSWLSKNPEVKPDIFYFWASSPRFWIQKIIELRGETNPLIIAAFSMEPGQGSVERLSDMPLDLCREFSQKYQQAFIGHSSAIISYPLGLAREVQDDLGGEIKIVKWNHRGTEHSFGLHLLRPQGSASYSDSSATTIMPEALKKELEHRRLLGLATHPLQKLVPYVCGSKEYREEFLRRCVVSLYKEEINE